MQQKEFYARGKILLTSEYLVLNGAKAIALPLKLGQKMKVTSKPSSSPHISWKAYDHDNSSWMNTTFDHDCNNDDILHKILKTVKSLNPDFCDSGLDIIVETHLEFSKDWGLGSSSTLISLIAQWANICPFTVLDKTLGGSGYDIACATANGPILYQKNKKASSVQFNPDFKDDLYFVYLNQKQSTAQSVENYKKTTKPNITIIEQCNNFVEKILEIKHLQDFEKIITEHDKMIGGHIGLTPMKNILFPDYWGAIKSLGAWGGDFILATSSHGDKATFDYFKNHGYNTVIKYKDLVLNS